MPLDQARKKNTEEESRSSHGRRKGGGIERVVLTDITWDMDKIEANDKVRVHEKEDGKSELTHQRDKENRLRR